MWQPEVGKPCEYYCLGFRYGVVVRMPIKGQRKGMAQIENPTPRWARAYDAKTGKAYYEPRPKTREWVDVSDVWEPGTPPPSRFNIWNLAANVIDAAKTRAEAKAEQQEKADKVRERGRMFHR